MIVRFIVGCVFVGFFKPMTNFEMQNCILSNGDAPTPSPHLHHRRRRNELETIAPEVVGVGGFPRAHRYNYAIRSRGLWDLGNKDDRVCYECNWKMVRSGRLCTRTRLLLSLLKSRSFPLTVTNRKLKLRIESSLQ